MVLNALSTETVYIGTTERKLTELQLTQHNFSSI